MKFNFKLKAPSFVEMGEVTLADTLAPDIECFDVLQDLMDSTDLKNKLGERELTTYMVGLQHGLLLAEIRKQKECQTQNTIPTATI